MAKKLSKSAKGRPAGLSPLHFFGDRQSPDSAENILDRRSILGDSKTPAELKRLMTHKSVYFYGESDAKKPPIEITRVKTSGPQTAWKVDLPVNNLYAIPDELNQASACQVEPLAVALHAVNRAALRPAERVAVLGCGGIGLLILQAARTPESPDPTSSSPRYSCAPFSERAR